jgi:hypothetical protein
LNKNVTAIFVFLDYPGVIQIIFENAMKWFHITHCLWLASFYFFWSFIRHVSSYQKNLGCSHFLIRFFKKLTTFSKMEISISVKIWIPEIFIIIYQLNNPCQNGSSCEIVQLSHWYKYFFNFFKLWHDLETLKLIIWYKIRFFFSNQDYSNEGIFFLFFFWNTQIPI